MRELLTNHSGDFHNIRCARLYGQCVLRNKADFRNYLDYFDFRVYLKLIMRTLRVLITWRGSVGK